MLCPSCQNQNADGATFCGSCGAVLSEEGSQTAIPAVSAPPAGEISEIPQEQRTWGMLCHALVFSGYIIPFGNIIGPLVVWLMKKDEMPFVKDQGKEVLNFQISIMIYALVSFLLIFALIGFLLLPAVVIFSIVMTILGIVRSNKGEYVRYPLCIRLVK